MVGTNMAVEVVGRDEELSSLSAFLDRPAAGQGPIAVALEGAAGIGKSTLWRAAVEDARGRGLRVLVPAGRVRADARPRRASATCSTARSTTSCPR